MDESFVGREENLDCCIGVHTSYGLKKENITFYMDDDTVNIINGGRYCQCVF